MSPLQATSPYEIKTHHLPNGSHLLLLPAQSSGLLAVYLLLEGRNYLEPEGQEGITEVVHQLIGLGPRGIDEIAFAETLRSMGAELQSADRAFLPFDDYYTSPDFSFVRFQALEEYARPALALLRKAVCEPRLDPEELERIRSATLARLARQDRSAGNLARAHLRGLLYGPDHPAARSPYGSAAAIAALGLDEVREHHRRLLDPRRVWLAVVSNLPPPEVIEWASHLVPAGETPNSATLGMTAERFAVWSSRQTAAAEASIRFAASAPRLELTAGGERAHVVEAVLLAAERDDGGLSPTDETATRIAAELLSARLAFRLREEQGMAYGIGADLQRLDGQLLYVAAAGTRPENIERMATGFRDVRLAAATAGTAPEEITRAARSLYGSTLRRQESRLNQAMYAVWAAREGGDPLDWWRQAEQLAVPDRRAVADALEQIATADAAVVIVVR